MLMPAPSPLSEFCQKALPSQFVAHGSDKSHGKGHRLHSSSLEFRDSRVAAALSSQSLAHACRERDASNRERAASLMIDQGMAPHDMRHLVGDQESDLVPLPLAHFQ